MTYLSNDPAAFADQALAGLAAAHPDHIVAVPGGVVRATPSPDGQVVVIAGGGTGHSPAFAGWVGPGLLAGAACGDVFASPSSERIRAVARAADAGGGIVFLVINYAGDVLNFSVAAEQLRADGIDARVVIVTDDIASGGPDDRAERRGIAGALFVHKVAAEAAAEGLGPDEVERLATEANARTASLGVAFTGCTLPGADAPLFELAEGTMGLGLGIHGEAGLRELDRLGADATADLLVDQVCDDLQPQGGDRVVAVVNGLGAASHEELYVSYRRVAERLAAAGLTVVAPAVGEFVTSLEMSGYSLTLAVLTPELERLWLAPVDTPALAHGRLDPDATRRATDRVRAAASAHAKTAPAHAETVATPASQRAAGTVVAWLTAVSATLDQHERELGDLDAVAGDGDHGRGMAHGAEAAVQAARAAAQQGAGARATLTSAAHAWSSRAGGTSGALWGAGLEALADRLGDTDPVSFPTLVRACSAFSDTVVARGGAAAGEKTMVDALLPFVEALRAASADDDPATVWRTAAAAADEAARATAQFPARKGRARSHGDKSIGVADPGAVSFALIVAAVTPGT